MAEKAPSSTAKRRRYPMPSDVKEELAKHGLTDAYNARPPYQRNDYIRWINEAKRDATRKRRIGQMLEELRQGDKYMKMPYNPKDPAP